MFLGFSCVKVKAFVSLFRASVFSELAGVDPELTVNQTWHQLNSTGGSSYRPVALGFLCTADPRDPNSLVTVNGWSPVSCLRQPWPLPHHPTTVLSTTSCEATLNYGWPLLETGPGGTQRLATRSQKQRDGPGDYSWRHPRLLER